MTKFKPEDFAFLGQRKGSEPPSDEHIRKVRSLLSRIKGPEDFLEFANVAGDSPWTFGYPADELAVNQPSPDDIRFGLLLTALDYMTTPDWRDIIGGLAVSFRVAELLNRDPIEEFASVALLLRGVNGRYGPVDEWLLAFARREPDDREPEAFAYVEGVRDGRFQFWQPRPASLDTLVNVIPIGQTQTVNEATIILFSIERYTDGFRMLFRFDDAFNVTNVSLMFPWRVVDDRGQTYTSASAFTGLGGLTWPGHLRAWQDEVLVPSVDESVRRLTFRLRRIRYFTRVGKDADSEAVKRQAEGPWSFTVEIPPL